MTFEQMRIFLEAAHFGSFTHAAERLGLTQSAVSVSIKKLEERHGVLLFDRSGRRLLLTEAGQVLLNEAERILRDVELTIQRVESCRPESRSLLIACTETAYDFWLPELVGRANQTIACANVSLMRGSVEDVAAWVMRGTADAGITCAKPSHPHFRYVNIFSDRMILCGSPDRAGAIVGEVEWSNLRDHAPIIWESGELRSIVTAALAAQRVESDRLTPAALRLSGPMAVISSLRGGTGFGFVPERAARPHLEAKMLVKVGDLEIPIHYWAFSLRDRNIDPIIAEIAKAAPH